MRIKCHRQWHLHSKNNQMAVFVEWSQYIIWLSVHKLFTFCIRRCLVSRSRDWVMTALSSVLLIHSFQPRPAFVPCRSAKRHSGDLVYPLSDIGRCRKFEVSCTERTALGNDFELILTIKIETRHPIEGSFGSEFPAICNHCVVMAAWSRKTLKFCKKFLRFLEKRSLTVKFSKLCSESFHCDTDRRCYVQISFRFTLTTGYFTLPQWNAHTFNVTLQIIYFTRKYLIPLLVVRNYRMHKIKTA